MLKSLPIESLRTDSLEVMSLLGPVAPGGVLEPQSVDKIILLLRHKLPRRRNIIFVAPSVTQVVDRECWPDGGDQSTGVGIVVHRGRLGGGWFAGDRALWVVSC